MNTRRLAPASIGEFLLAGQQVLVETGEGLGIDFSDDDYCAVGASIVEGPAAVLSGSDLIVKVKELQSSEIALLDPRIRSSPISTLRRTSRRRKTECNREQRALHTRPYRPECADDSAGKVQAELVSCPVRIRLHPLMSFPPSG